MAGDTDAGFEVGEVRFIRETDKAIMVELEGGDEIWVPKSQVHDNSEVYGDHDRGFEGNLVVSSWFARKQGWD